MPRLFFSYSHADESYRDRLEKNLSMLVREGLIEAWHDRRIPPGAHVDHTIDTHLESSEIILLLASPDFLASEYCYDLEMRQALERHEAGTATVIPVILRPCEWDRTPFGRFRALPTDGRPISKWADLDDAFLDVTRGIRAALESRGLRAHKSPKALPSAQPPRPAPVRSSNLGVTQLFSDQDKDDFLREAFEYNQRYFENSLNELAARNSSIEVRFRQIDADRFTCVAYRTRSPVTSCTIWFGGRRGVGGGIGYLANDSGQTNSYNESLSVAADEHSLYLVPLGMSRVLGGRSAASKLTLEGGAEFLWSLFMEPLQRG